MKRLIWLWFAVWMVAVGPAPALADDFCWGKQPCHDPQPGLECFVLVETPNPMNLPAGWTPVQEGSTCDAILSTGGQSCVTTTIYCGPGRSPPWDERLCPTMELRSFAQIYGAGCCNRICDPRAPDCEEQ